MSQHCSMQLPSFENAQVLVVGDVMLDRYWHGPTSRISPEAPVPVVRVGREECRLGGAGNVAANAASLGARTHLLGFVGQDNHAEQIGELLQTHGVGNALIALESFPTITKLRVISRQQQLIRLDFEAEPSGRIALEQLVGKFKSLCDGQRVTCAVLSDYAKGALRDASGLIEAARSKKLPVVVDPTVLLHPTCMSSRPWWAPAAAKIRSPRRPMHSANHSLSMPFWSPEARRA